MDKKSIISKEIKPDVTNTGKKNLDKTIDPMDKVASSIH